MPRSAPFYFVLSLLALSLFSCRNGSDTPDVSGIKVAMRTRRFDRDIAQADTAHITAALQALKSKYPDFLDLWLYQLMPFGGKGDNGAEVSPELLNNLHTFLTFRDFRGLFDTVARHFPDTKSIDQPLEKGFQYYRYYYPARTVPGVIYFVSGLNHWSAITIDTTLVGIGLDMFLGGDYPFYASVGIPDYTARNCRPEAAPVAVFRAIYENGHPFATESRTLLDMMVQRGKEQFFLSKMLPFIADSTRLGFTAAQTRWCTENEAASYNFFVRSNLLYETNPARVIRYVQDGPRASGMPPESPGNVGSWIGWQIVKEYAAKHPKMSLDELLALPDAQAILQEGGYKPR